MKECLMFLLTWVVIGLVVHFVITFLDKRFHIFNFIFNKLKK